MEQDAQSGLNWLGSRARVAGCAAAAALAIGGLATYVGVYSAAPADASTSHAGARTLERKSSMPIASALYDIYQVIMPWDTTRESSKFAVTPSSAVLEPSAEKFTTNCEGSNIGSYKYLLENTSGTSDQSCGSGLGPVNIKATHGEFQTSLNKLGKTIAKSVKIKLGQTTERASGNTGDFTTTYECPSPTSGGESTPVRVRTIVLKRAARHTAATITLC
jgi:hypothetical protein